MKWLFPTLLAILTVMAASCGEYACSKAEMQFGLVGFSDAESDTIILRRFEKNGGRSVLKDTFLLTNIWFQRNLDTLKMVGFPGSALLQSDYNYEIFFPAASKLITIIDIKEEQLYIKPRGKVGCTNRIISYALDGRTTTNIVPYNVTYFTK
jgi:hypothetical protein